MWSITALINIDQLKTGKVSENGGATLFADIFLFNYFSLGFVTITTYKNQKLKHQDSDASPVLIGPVFIHYNGNEKTYDHFLAELSRQLQSDITFEISGEQIYMGADEGECLNWEYLIGFAHQVDEIIIVTFCIASNLTFVFLGKNFTCNLFVVWQYQLWSFKSGDTKLKRVLPKNQHTQRKFFWFLT